MKITYIVCAEGLLSRLRGSTRGGRCAHAASHGPVAAGDQDVGAFQLEFHLLWQAGSQFPGANDAAGFG